ncbi:MAG: Lin0512 family protein [Coriobacteriales bacterium]|jgi:uncharacterized protein (TIGR02058 family)|nr:Lin0512 family protein [Coriobacteriales bacterium]
MKCFVVEFGIGMDFHGQDVNKAAQKAVRDAVSKSCLCGLVELCELKNMDEQVEIRVTVAASDPSAVVAEDIAAILPIGKVVVNAVKGGLTVPGIKLEQLGDKDETIEAVLVALEVMVKQ